MRSPQHGEVQEWRHIVSMLEELKCGKNSVFWFRWEQVGDLDRIYGFLYDRGGKDVNFLRKSLSIIPFGGDAWALGET